MRPRNLAGPLAATLVTLGAWGLVARSSGSGWVQAIGALLAAVLVTGLLAPAVVAARVRVRCVGSPGDGTAGLPVSLVVESSQRVRARALVPGGPEVMVPGGPEVMVGPHRGRRPGSADELTLVPRRRGVHRTVTVEVATAAPFALAWWSRRLVVPLPTELHIGPRPGSPLTMARRPDELDGGRARPVPDVAGEPRGVRPYRPGDSPRRVHWPATAHHAALMVRETERPATAGIVVRVSLPADVDAAERTAERAYGTIRAALDRGVPVVLGTLETTGPCVAPVGDRRAAGRRLARAVAGPDVSGARADEGLIVVEDAVDAGAALP